MWKKPYRPAGEVTQSFNDGKVTVYGVVDSSQPGYKPVETLTPKAPPFNYAERSLGVNRYYSAKQNQIELERVIRIPMSNIEISNQDIAETEDGVKYRIDLVQTVLNVYPRSLDLTLVLFAQNGRETAESEEES